MKIYRALLSVVGLLFCFTSSATENLRIGVLYWSMDIPGQVAMREGLEAEAARLNDEAKHNGQPALELIPRVAGNGPAGIERQIAQMHELIALRPKVILVQPTDNAALAQPLRAANAAGIPVVAYDQYISGGKLAAYVTSDNRQAGYLGGEYLAAQFPPGKTLRLILVDYPSVSSTVERLDGFLDALRERQRPYQILRRYQAVEPVAGRTAAASILREFPQPGSVDAIFTVNDGGGLAIVDALARAGREEILVASVDGDPRSVENIRSARLTAIDAAQFCGPLGAQAMRHAATLARGGKVPQQTLLPVFPVTRETLSAYPGWQGPIPPSFRKSWPAAQPMWNNQPRHTP